MIRFNNGREGVVTFTSPIDKNRCLISFHKVGDKESHQLHRTATSTVQLRPCGRCENDCGTYIDNFILSLNKHLFKAVHYAQFDRSVFDKYSWTSSQFKVNILLLLLTHLKRVLNQSVKSFNYWTTPTALSV